MKENFADVLESYMIAEEGLISKLREINVNKEKLKAMRLEFSKEHPEAVASKFVHAVKSQLVDGHEGDDVIRKAVKILQDSDKTLTEHEKSNITSYDFIIKSISGVTVAILPDSKNPALGVSMILVPLRRKSGKVVEGTILGNEIPKAIINPNKVRF